VVIQLVIEHITDISTKTNKRLFGQDQQEIAYDSPNAKVIRTGQAGNRLRKSECEGYSDRSSRKSPMIVRM
jgi:hypothetical protein